MSMKYQKCKHSLVFKSLFHIPQRSVTVKFQSLFLKVRFQLAIERIRGQLQTIQSSTTLTPNQVN
jgi:hypothetical protein